MTAQSHRGFVRGDRVKLTDRAAEQQTRGYWNSPRHDRKNVALAQAWIAGLETWACAVCRGEEPDEMNYVIFNSAGKASFFGPAANHSDAAHRLAAADESYVDGVRVHELDAEETQLMRQWVADGQKTSAWPFDWSA